MPRPPCFARSSSLSPWRFSAHKQVRVASRGLLQEISTSSADLINHVLPPRELELMENLCAVAYHSLISCFTSHPRINAQLGPRCSPGFAPAFSPLSTSAPPPLSTLCSHSPRSAFTSLMES